MTDEQTRLLVHVQYAAAAVEECVESLRQAVERARSSGVTWAQLGHALRTSEEEARAQFSRAG
jgi:hypothetical protein